LKKTASIQDTPPVCEHRQAFVKKRFASTGRLTLALIRIFTILNVLRGKHMVNWRRLLFMLTVLALVVCIYAAADAGPFEDGKAAYDQQDYKTALKLWEHLADHGDAEAQRMIGVLFRDGLGVAQDNAEALAWFGLAADQGNAVAQYNIGLMYRDGSGMAQNNAEAVKWFRLAAGQGYAPAQFEIGTAYKLGLGVTPDNIRAYLWYSYAAARDNNYVRSRDILAHELTPDQIEAAKRLAIELPPAKN